MFLIYYSYIYSKGEILIKIPNSALTPNRLSPDIAALTPATSRTPARSATPPTLTRSVCRSTCSLTPGTAPTSASSANFEARGGVAFFGFVDLRKEKTFLISTQEGEPPQPRAPIPSWERRGFRSRLKRRRGCNDSRHFLDTVILCGERGQVNSALTLYL